MQAAAQLRLSDEDRSRVDAVIERHREALRAIEGFVAARPGFAVRAGRLVREPALVVYVDRRRPASALRPAQAAPVQLEGIAIDVRVADPVMQLEAQRGPEPVAAALASPYVGLPGHPIDAEFTLTTPLLCHVGPDAGWPVLASFIGATRESFDAAIYDFSATHVAEALLERAQERDLAVRINIDDGLAQRETEIQQRLADSLGERFAQQVITCGSGQAFPSAYHEKVIVRDAQGVWLSSGNWSPASQPDFDPIANPAEASGMYSKGNREWHVVADDAALSDVFARYLDHDRATAQASSALAGAEPMPDLFVAISALQEAAVGAALAVPVPAAPRLLPKLSTPYAVRPLLSPDNYAERISEWVHSAQQSLFLQYSYIRWSDRDVDARFRALLSDIGELSWRDDFDLRVIIGSNDAATLVARLAENGWNEARLRAQSRVHNKGIVVDGKSVLVSSQNWSGDGFLRNRDAGLIIFNDEVARYYQDVFLSDWEERTRSPFGAGTGGNAMLAGPGSPPAGMVRMRWQDYFEE